MLISLSSTVNRKHTAVPLPGFAGGRLRPGTTSFCVFFFYIGNKKIGLACSKDSNTCEMREDGCGTCGWSELGAGTTRL